MAGFRFKIEEKDLLVNIMRASVDRYDKQVAELKNGGADELLVIGAEKTASTARNILDKINGTFAAEA